jgi:hypothetical protein
MFKNRRLRVFVIVGVILDLAAIGLVIGLHERTVAQRSSDKRAARNDRFDFGVNTIQEAVFAWAETHGTKWPTPDDVTQEQLGPYLRGATWPINPYDGRAMHQGTGPGDYRYRATTTTSGQPTSAYILTGTYPDRKPYDYVFIEGPGPMRVNDKAGAALIDGYTTSSGGGGTEGGPNELDGISLTGMVRWHAATSRADADIRITDATTMFDASGVEVPRDGQFSYESKVLYWRVVARRSGSGWVALKLQALVTCEHR